MKLSHVIKCDKCYFSKDGLFLLHIVENKIFLTELNTFEICRIYVSSYKIDNVDFSNDNIHFLALIKNKGCVYIYSLYKENIIKKIEDFCQTYLDSIFLYKDSNICVYKYEKKCFSIYDINNVEESLVNIENAKFKKSGYCSNDEGSIFACITQNNNKIEISLISLLNYNVINNISCNNLNPNKIFFTKENNIIAFNNKKKSLHMYKTNGELLFIYTYKCELPCINVVAKNEIKNILSVGFENGVVKILSLRDFKEIETLLLDDIIIMNQKLKIYKENISNKDTLSSILSKESNISSHQNNKEKFAYYSNKGIKEGEYKLKHGKEKSNEYVKKNFYNKISKIGITALSFSICGNYLAVINENHSNVVRIYEMENHSCIAILEQKKLVTSMYWDNILYKARLLICTNTSHLFVWLPDECAVLDMPRGFICRDAKWNCYGTVLLAKNDEKLMVFCPKENYC
ncbi:conserved Plasmodium protein, unknown function [Plasmodium gallinaceum]|uniref:WD repeat-containing protein WRAP73 n=1 Tax=Plasmodium gallinaceum TaxID=5849 RepID=A0A1J1GV44_PLAGA|nr:conserved Plasmodium protein, unknown function [Plasmodium gallinaceum]CRG96110.1 conserved Plasmodium protein, unknown function [Plasmodium gallinaceum]